MYFVKLLMAIIGMCFGGYIFFKGWALITHKRYLLPGVLMLVSSGVAFFDMFYNLNTKYIDSATSLTAVSGILLIIGIVCYIPAKKSADNELQRLKQKQQQYEIEKARAAAEKEKRKALAYEKADYSQKKRLEDLEKSIKDKTTQMAMSMLTGHELMEMHEHSTLKGVAASAVAGPLAGGIVKAVGDEHNRQIDIKNGERRVNNAIATNTEDRLRTEIAQAQQELESLINEILDK